MAKKSRWLIRISFLVYLVYIYLTVYRQGGFFSFLLLNTFLGYLPIELAMHLDHKQPLLLFVPLGILWLLFYPNAPYLLTDLFHLSRINPYNPETGLMSFNLHNWLNFTNILVSALSCSILGTWSLEHVANQIMLKIKAHSFWLRNAFVFVLILAASIGVYVGRFLRLHTAYLFFNPDQVIDQLVEMWSPRMLVFVTFMTLIQMVIWITLRLYLSANDTLVQEQETQTRTK
ncbi:membrane protein [Ligilactobacillus salitolerans]|uniref:Membrane protein n=1 Tax=Ligilactobacillus salitolerans TaxID=1808352 RepID=A0A401IUD2_9LACO|nr:DUF1361 domain-containing protein [Ligilactobacillus salitolerans]GBG95134.1 membrane protein [Ligilactobacillus salitolerans]